MFCSGLDTSLQDNLTFVAPERMHLTLHFLGEINETQVRVLRAELDRTIRHHRFEMQYEGAGCFPTVRRPRALWIGCRDADEAECRSSPLNGLTRPGMARVARRGWVGHAKVW